jgi:hypothetical protein
MSTLSPIKIPEIRFKNGWFLTTTFLKGSKLPSYSKMDKRTQRLHKTWNAEEKKIIRGMQKIAGLNFYQNLIDVYIVAGLEHAFSDPMVIGTRYTKGEKFVDVLTHELLHRLITDNTQNKNGGFWPHKLFPKIEDHRVITHILVHALHKELYLKVLKRPDRLRADIKECQQWPSYREAWNIVEKEGSLNIIKKFRESKPRADKLR